MRKLWKNGRGFATGIATILTGLSFLLPTGYATAAYVTITAPANGTSVSSTVSISAAMSSPTAWINLYIDGHYYASGPPTSVSWNSASVANGSHTISARAYASGGSLLGSSAVSVSVANGSSTIGSAGAYYFSPSGSDSNTCTLSKPCKSLARAQALINNMVAGQALLFQRGATWYGGITMPLYVNGASGNPIVISNYGTGALPVIDGNHSAAACFYARYPGQGSTPLWSYLTIDGFECRNTTLYGIVFSQEPGGSAGMPGIVVKNMNIHNTGPSYDDGGYHNQLMFMDENSNHDGVQFLANSVTSCGGHNCIQVHHDLGHPIISGNYCAGWHHNCIDLKSVVGATVKNNTVNGNGALGGAGFYHENTQIPASDVTFERNIVYGPVDGFECEWGGSGSGVSTTCRIYNNTAYLGLPSAVTTGGDSTCGNVKFDIRNNVFDTSFTYYNGHNCTTPYWDYNDDGASRGRATGPVGAHDLKGINPMYVNAAGHDFRLQSASPCINAGIAGLLSGLSNIGAW